MSDLFDNSVFKDPKLAVDIGLLCWDGEDLRILVIRRADVDEVGGEWALPGAFVRFDETTDQAANRVLGSKARLDSFYLEQLQTFSTIDRDPRGRVVSVAYFALTPCERLRQVAETQNDLILAKVELDENNGSLIRLLDSSKNHLSLAFDHQDIIEKIILRLRGKIDYTPIALSLLPQHFTLREVQQVFETITCKRFAKPAFRRKFLDRKIARATGKMETGSAFRPAELYTAIKH